jgi:hypothetical protein
MTLKKLRSSDALDVPEADSGDVIHAAVTSVISTIPFVGGGELFKFIVAPSIEKRRDQWMNAVAEAIRELQRRAGFDLDTLQANEEFTTFLLQTTQSALKTHLQSKHQLLKTALINATVASYSFDTKQLYLSIIDRLTTAHIDILVLVERYKHFTVSIRSADRFYEKMAELQEIPKLAIECMPFQAFLRDLEQAGLIVTSSNFKIIDADVEQTQFLITEESGSRGLPHMEISDLGRNFLRFISE